MRAEKTALRLIARAEQCQAGLTRKLERRGYEPACVRAVISRLTEMQLVDDGRFARLWLESRSHLTRSPRQMLVSLSSRGIDRDDATAAIKAVLNEENELSLLMRYVEKLNKSGKSKQKYLDDGRSLKYLLKSEGFSVLAIQQYFEVYCHKE
ncbi:MAG: recombination regulator RecX [Treponema sp.]|nr:recombination regulator RecX [Treponema sp.]